LQPPAQQAEKLTWISALWVAVVLFAVVLVLLVFIVENSQRVDIGYVAVTVTCRLGLRSCWPLCWEFCPPCSPGSGAACDCGPRLAGIARPDAQHSAAQSR